MKPYYQDDYATIYHGDCREIVVRHDLVVTDPPYNCGYHYDSYGDDLSEEEYIKLLRRAITGSSVVIHYPEDSINILPSALGPVQEVVAWIYSNPIPVPKDFRLICWRHCYPEFNNEKEPYASATIKDKRAAGKMKAGRGLRDWWLNEQVRFPQSENTDHPCQIPVRLIKRVLTITEGDVVLDPFMGSGTTLIAAKERQQKAIGIEIEEKYCEIAAKRLAQEVLNFGGPVPKVEETAVESGLLFQEKA